MYIPFSDIFTAWDDALWNHSSTRALDCQKTLTDVSSLITQEKDDIRFLSLPIEIRLLIYSFYCPEDWYAKQCPATNNIIGVIGQRCKAQRLPSPCHTLCFKNIPSRALILTCRQIQTEFEPIYYARYEGLDLCSLPDFAQHLGSPTVSPGTKRLIQHARELHLTAVPSDWSRLVDRDLFSNLERVTITVPAEKPRYCFGNPDELLIDFLSGEEDKEIIETATSLLESSMDDLSQMTHLEISLIRSENLMVYGYHFGRFTSTTRVKAGLFNVIGHRIENC